MIAFGELHQTRATAKVRSAIARFTDEILPVVAPHASHLIVETWITRGTCGEAETHVTEEVARTTERPVETESEIMKLLRRAKELGVAPHVLDVGCDEYKVLAGEGGTSGRVDYDKLLTITNQHLERAIGQGLLLPRAPGRPLVVVYGGALHNDLFPDPTLAKYTFGRHVHAATRGAYREIDLYVPEMVDAHAGVEGGAVVPRLAARGRGRERRRHPAQPALGDRGVPARQRARSRLPRAMRPGLIRDDVLSLLRRRAGVGVRRRVRRRGTRRARAASGWA